MDTGITRTDLEQLNIVYWQLDHAGDKRLAEAVRDIYYFCEGKLDEMVERTPRKKKTDYEKSMHSLRNPEEE